VTVSHHHLARSVLLGCFCLSGVATAEEDRAARAAAQALFDEGKKLLVGHEITAACEKFEESARIAPLSGTLLNLGDCYEQQGKLATAWSTFINAASLANQAHSTAREQEARRRATTLAPRLPKLVVRIAGGEPFAGLQVTRDDSSVGTGQFGVAIPVDPGEHRVVATAPGRREWRKTVETEPNSTVTVEVPELEADSVPSAPTTQPVSNATPRAASSPATPARQTAPTSHSSNGLRNAAYITGGVGVLGLAAGSIFGALSLQKHHQADQHCEYDQCRDAAGIDARNAARAFGNLSTAGFIVGAVGLTTGVTLWLVAPRAETNTPRLSRVSSTGTGLLLEGTWE
jgi:hypothetical protein